MRTVAIHLSTDPDVIAAGAAVARSEDAVVVLLAAMLPQAERDQLLAELLDPEELASAG